LTIVIPFIGGDVPAREPIQEGPVQSGACRGMMTAMARLPVLIAALALPCCAVLGPGLPRGPRTGMRVEGRFLHDRCGERVVLRGVNHPTMYVDRAGDALPEIARTGANVVRLGWAATHGISIREVEPAIRRAVRSGLIPILEMHDSTGKWELEPIVAYWTSPEALALVDRHRDTLVVNIANEANPPSPGRWVADYADIVRRMRAAGIHTPLIVDSGNFGRDHRLVLDQGPRLLAADPERNLMLSVHLYDPLPEAELAALFARSVAMDLPLLVGEFASAAPDICTAVDYRAIIRQAARHDIGWLAWSWGDADPASWWNEDHCPDSFDMTTTFSADSLRSWGKVVATDSPDSIRQTARRPRSLVTGRCR
jgi:mannan endo-1,4-beta-mannosidase